MAADKKGMDEISPLGESADSTEEKVISVRIPKRTETEEDKATTSTIEAPKEETEETTPVKKTASAATEEKPAVVEEKTSDDTKDEKEATSSQDATDVSEDKPTETTSEGVSSFSLLDAHEDKAGDKEEKPAETSTTGETSQADEAKDSIQKWLDDSDETASQEEGGSKKKWLIIAFILVVLVGAIGGGVYYYQTQIATEKAVVVETEPTTMVPTATPSPTEAPEAVDLTEYSVQVLNGTGTAGEATKVANLLEDAGFETPDTGNGLNYNFTDTEVQMIDGTPEAVYEAISKALGDDYSVVMVDEPLEDDADYDVVVTFGSSGPKADANEDTIEEGI